jgi:hypothetical protein
MEQAITTESTITQTETPAIQGLTGSSEVAKQQANWFDPLPDEFKTSDHVKNHKSLDDFVKTSLEAQKVIGKKGIIKPGDGATEGDWNEYYKALGRPEKPEEYGFSKPEAWKEMPYDENLIPKFSELLHKNGIPAESAKGLWNDYHNIMLESYKSEIASREKEVQKSLADLRTEIGGEDAFNSMLETARVGVRETGGEELLKFLEETGLGNHPPLIKAFHEVGKMLRNDSLVTKTESLSGLSTPLSAKNELERIQKDTKLQRVYLGIEGTLQEQKELQQRVLKLYEKVNFK